MRPLTWAAVGLVGGYAYFHRTPDRTIPPGLDTIVSPADGRVIHIERSDSQQLAFFKQDVLNTLFLGGMSPPFKVVVIELTILDVHVQRAPLAGRVLTQQYYPGQHQNAVFGADVAHLARSNEKLLTVIQGQRAAVGVVQVAGLMARRIIPYCKPGDVLAKGEKLGMITFGSQVVLVIPDAAQLLVKVGDRLTDGASVVAQLPALAPPAALASLALWPQPKYLG
jgi:phosphatidylserine decarboxylase